MLNALFHLFPWIVPATIGLGALNAIASSPRGQRFQKAKDVYPLYFVVAAACLIAFAISKSLPWYKPS